MAKIICIKTRLEITAPTVPTAPIKQLIDRLYSLKSDLEEAGMLDASDCVMNAIKRAMPRLKAEWRADKKKKIKIS